MLGPLNRSKRLADKFFYGTLAILVIVLGGMGSFIIHQRVNDLHARLDRRIATTAHYLEGILPYEVSRLSAKGIRSAIGYAASDELQAIEIFDENDNRLYVYEREGSGKVLYDIKIGHDLVWDDIRVGRFEAYFSKGPSMTSIRRRELSRLILMISAAGLAMGGGIFFLVRRLVVYPIEEAKNFSAELASGNYEHRLPITSPDEIGVLQKSLNDMAESLENYVDQLLDASRMKSEFLANLSHEIRTPMNAVIGFVDVLLSDEPNEERRDLLKTIKQSSNILLETIEHILHLSRIKSGEVKLETASFMMSDLVEEITPIVKQRLVGKSVSFESDLSEDFGAPFLCDRHRLRQVLINLLINSAKFTNDGKISLSIKMIPSNTALIQVCDTGIGIPKEEHDRIFEPFTQVDASHTRQYGGTGLGLAIAKQLVELMGGKIWLQSEPGAGTTVSFTIPRQEGLE